MAEEEGAEQEVLLQVFSVAVERNSIKVLTLPDRRTGQANPTPIRWIYQRQLEVLLHGRSDGGSTGSIWKALNRLGLGTTSLLCCKKTVSDRHILPAEFAKILDEFRAIATSIDPLATGAIRKATLVPLSAAKAVVEEHGRSPMTIAFLRAINQPVPRVWELHEQAEADEASREVDYVLLDQIAIENEFETENVASFEAELQKGSEFVDVAADEQKLAQYALSPAPPLQKELDDYKLARTAIFNAKRTGGKIEEISAEQSCKCVLRFLGFVQKTNQIDGLREADIKVDFFLRPDLGGLIERFAKWLKQTQQTKCSTISNYLNGLVGFLEHLYSGLAPTDAIFQMQQTPLDMCTNLRAQADAEAKQEGKRENLKGGFIEWADVQKARVKCVKATSEAAKAAKTPADYDKLRKLLKEAAAISLSSLLPPDRVGVIRKLTFGRSLKKTSAGAWKIELDGIADKHKTTKFYGSFASSLPKELNPVLDAYYKELSMQPGGDGAALFHGSNSDLERFMEPSNWSRWFKAMMKKWSGKEIAPKALRQSFVTWIRDSEAAPEVLKSAAHAMKHTVQTADNTYDEGKDTRLVQAAYLFNIQFAETFAAPTDFGAGSAASSGSSGSGGAGGSGVVPPEAEGDEEYEWEELSGGPWQARAAQDQSKAPDGKRLYRFEVKLDHEQFYSCARLRIPTVCGGPLGGFYLTLPITAGSAKNLFPYHLPLLATATRTATIRFDRVLIQKPDAKGGSTTSSDDEDADDDDLPPVSEHSVHSANDARKVLSGRPTPPEDEEEANVEDARFAIRNTHLECTVRVASGAPESLQALSRRELVMSKAPLPPEPGVVRCELTADQIAAANAIRGDLPPLPPSQPAPPPVSTARKSKRPVKAPRFYDDEVAKRPPTTPATPETPFEDMLVPAFVQVGGLVVAEGNHATGRKFVAKVLEIRRRFPPIVVRFQENLTTGETGALSLPDPKIAHVHAGQVEQHLPE